MQPVHKPLVFRSGDSLAAWAAAIALIAIAVVAGYAISERRGHALLADRASQQLDLYATGLESELARHDNLPSILELDKDVLALLDRPADAGLRDTVNRRLANLSVRAGSVSILLLDPQGHVLASSDWYAPANQLGADLSQAPYVVESLQGGQSRFFSAANEREAPECHFAQAFRRGGRAIGVAVVKISLEPLRSAWIEAMATANSDKLLVIDDEDVVIMSSHPAWEYRTGTPVSDERRARLAAMGKYPRRPILPLGIRVERSLNHGAQLLRLPLQPDAEPLRFVSQERVMARSGWRLVSMSDASSVAATARNTALAAAAVAGLVGVLGLYLLQRRRHIANRLAAREALQRAYDELDQRVRERTRELQEANAALVGEVAERRRAESELREAQNELLQAEKLALIGQMSAGIAHEINQPLTALRALSDNTRRLLQLGRTDEAALKLHSIAELTERMGRITAQLKSFARKVPVGHSVVVLAEAVQNSVEMLRNRIDAEDVEVDIAVAADLRVVCEPYRLEQVLVNLITNALDAMRASARRRVTVSASRVDGRTRLRVADSGPGIPKEAREHLFEPFFSTKPPGEGLGLGLVISSSIVREFGGQLRAVDPPAGVPGAVFEFELASEEEVVHG